MQHETILETMPSGLKVVLENIPHRKAVAVGISLPVGSRFETDSEMGFSHFTEHLLFKGTQRRNYAQISREIEKLGGYINAGTTKESTVYYSVLSGKHLDVSLDVLSDIFHDSIFNGSEFLTEKKVILEEIKMGQDDAEEAVFDLFYETVFGDTPLGRPIAGTPSSIEKSTRDDLYDFYTQNYGHTGAVLSIAGNVWNEGQRPKDILARIEKFFERDSFSLKGAPSMKGIQSSAHFHSGKIVHQKRKLEQMHFIIGLPGQSVAQTQDPHLLVFNNSLGGSSSSRLFRVLREENGLCYSIGSHHSAYYKEGIWLIYCACSGDQFFKAVGLTLGLLREALEKGLESDEIEESKSSFAGYLELASESPSHRAEANARSLLYLGRLTDTESRIRDIENIPVEKIMPSIRSLWNGVAPTFTSMGPLRESKVGKKIGQIFKDHGF